MSEKPYDSLFHQEMDAHPADWANYLSGLVGLRVGELKMLDGDVSSIVRQADKLYDLGDHGLLHIEVQSGHQLELPRRGFVYNTLISDRYSRPVTTVLMLVRPDADSPSFSGRYTKHHPITNLETIFEYKVIRVWQLSLEQILQGGRGIWTLALLTNEARPQLAQVMSRIDVGLKAAGLSELEQEEYRFKCGIALGLRYDERVINELMSRSDVMKESSFYQMIAREGREEGREEGEILALRKMILRLGQRHLGSPDESQIERLNNIQASAQLEAMIDRIDLGVTTWDELFAS